MEREKKKKKKKISDNLLPVSKDCLQQGTKTQEEEKTYSVQPNDVSVNIVAHLLD